VRTINVALRQEKNKLDSSGVFLQLLQIRIDNDETLYLVPNPAPVTFAGQTYTPFGCKVDNVQHDLRGGLEEVEVKVSNVTREISAYVELHDLRGAAVKLLTVNSLHLADPTAIVWELDFEVTEINVKDDLVAFRLGHERLLQQRIPAQRYLRNNCRWKYKSPECGYAGGLPTCDKILEGDNGCRAHANVRRFGAFPGMPSGGGRILG